MRNGRSNLWRGEALGVGALVLALSFLAFFGATAEAATRLAVLEPVPEVTGAEKVFAFGADGRDALKDLAGRGIPTGDTEPSPVADPSGLRWIPEWEWHDDLGFRHLRYRQVVPVDHASLTGLQGLLSDTKYGRDGIALFGGVMGVHYDRRGLLHLVYGAQFRELEIANQLNVHEPESAILLAHSLVESVDGYEPGDWVTWVPERVDELKARTELRLYPVGDGKGFRFTWEVPSLDAREMPYTLLLDAQSGEVWAARPEFAEGSRCQAPANQPNSALFAPGCDGILPPIAGLWATPAPDLPSPYSRVAARSGSWGFPSIEVIQPLAPPFACPEQPCWPENEACGLVPLSGSPPIYQDAAGIMGCAAGAALSNTYLTLSTLASFGWNSFDGQGSPAHVQSHRNDICNNGWYFSWHPFWDSSAAVFGCAPGSREPTAYCLDWVGHEWGHGTVFAKGVNYEGVHKELHEGFADIVGYGTFLLNYPTYDYDGFHWDLASFCNFSVRSARDDNGAGSFHVNDQLSSTPHYQGNKLAVAFRMLAEGVQNPACGRLNNCSLVPDALGLNDAFHVLFRTLTAYMNFSSSWNDLPWLAKMAAFDLFGWCPPGFPPGYSAEWQQEAVGVAFSAIGFPTAGIYECWYPDQED